MSIFLIFSVITIIVLFLELKKSEVKYTEEKTKLATSVADLSSELFIVKSQLQSELERNKTIISQKKSSETRVGNITENLIPLLSGLPYDPTNLKHLGQPIDFVYFDYDNPQIIFIEVKSGNAKENKRQKIIKNCIKKGMIYYEKIQVNENGIKVKRDINED